jgi:tetratricopeptide (TPR) repeat protein
MHPERTDPLQEVCMNKSIIAVCIILCTTLIAQTVDELVDQAVELYETRHLNAVNLGEARTLLEGVIEQEPKHSRALHELSHVYFLIGDKADTKEEKLELYNLGKDHGEQAIKADKGNPEAHFWYMVNMGRIGQTRGVLNSLFMVPDIRDEIETVLKIDPEHTGALDAKAMLYFELPGVLGGSLTKTIECLDQAIALDSNYTLLYVDMAKAYIKDKNFEKARWYLNRALQITDPTYPADHKLDDKPEAELLLDEIKQK